MNDDEEIEVPWTGGARARVSAKPYRFIIENVKEADTQERIAALYKLGSGLRVALQFPDAPIETERGRIARGNRTGAKIVEAWDEMERAMYAHPTFAGDVAKAMQALGADIAEAGKYSAALRSVIEGYRRPRRIPNGGRSPRTHSAALVEAAAAVRVILAVTENRAAAIVAALANLIGRPTDSESLRQTLRNQRV